MPFVTPPAQPPVHPRGQISFRPVQDSDRAFLFGLFASTRAWEFEHTLWSAADKQDFLSGQFDAQDRHYRMSYLGASFMVIQMDGTDIGRLSVQRQSDCLRIIDMVLAPEWCGRGIGSDILRALMHEAEGGKVPVRLSVLKHSPALSLYRRLGFVAAGDMGHHLAMEWHPATGPREI